MKGLFSKKNCDAMSVKQLKLGTKQVDEDQISNTIKRICMMTKEAKMYCSWIIPGGGFSGIAGCNPSILNQWAKCKERKK